MKWTPFLTIMIAATAACQTRREFVAANGNRYSDGGHLAGNTAVVMKPDGTFIAYNKMNQPWQDLMQTIGAIAVADASASVGKSITRSREVTRLGAQRTSIERIRAANELEKLRLAADLEKFRLLHPETLPSTALP